MVTQLVDYLGASVMLQGNASINVVHKGEAWFDVRHQRTNSRFVFVTVGYFFPEIPPHLRDLPYDHVFVNHGQWHMTHGDGAQYPQEVDRDFSFIRTLFPNIPITIYLLLITNGSWGWCDSWNGTSCVLSTWLYPLSATLDYSTNVFFDSWLRSTTGHQLKSSHLRV